MSASFERLCLAAGLEALGEMMEADAQTACGPRHGRGKERTAHRWGKTKGKIGFHGGKVEIARPRLRSFDGKEQALPSWEGAMTEDWLGKWAMNQMLINVSTRKFARSMRLPEGDVPAPNGSGLSKSAASRRFVALSAASARRRRLRSAEPRQARPQNRRTKPASGGTCARNSHARPMSGPVVAYRDKTRSTTLVERSDG